MMNLLESVRSHRCRQAALLFFHMRLRRRFFTLALLVLGCGMAAIFVQPMYALGSDAELEARLESSDKGASSIDVTKYSNELREAYEIFSEKCSQCHSLGRPINSDFALPDEWQRYVKRMMRKPDSGISSSQAKLIYEFLVVDASERRPELLNKKLLDLTSAERAVVEEKVREIRQKYSVE